MTSTNSEKRVRTRFAPSPTGFVHVGSLRTALYAYLFAKKNNGDFLLRVEDTDQSREVAGAVENLLFSLKWAGIEPDEGVCLDQGGKASEKGDFGPYTQSKRLEIYQGHVQELVDKGFAYYCFCTSERLETLRQAQEANKRPTKYDRHCINLTPAEIEEKIKNGEKYVVRMKIPDGQTIEFTDIVRGQVRVNTSEIDDQIILKSDGFPTYHLASVVDDHLMEISHVIRAEEWLSSTPKHILLYQFFGWQAPEWAHLSLLLNADKTKLSKRQGDVAVEDYRAKGYLPEAVVNFVALLGWNPGTDQEILSMSELVEKFTLEKVHKAGAIFDLQKLDWMNGEYLKKMPLTDLKSVAMPFLEKNFGPENIAKLSSTLDQILIMEQQRISNLNQIGLGLDFLTTDKLDYDPNILTWKKSDAQGTTGSLKMLVEEVSKYSTLDWTAAKLQEKIVNFIKENNLTNGEMLWPMRVALTGLEKSPTPFEVAEILGQEKTLARLNEAISLLTN